MTRSPGQAARDGAHEAARRLHFLGQICLGPLIAVLLVIGALAVRLSQGPLQVEWLGHRAAEALSGEGRSVSVGGAEIAWEGMRSGIDRPVDIVLRKVRVTQADGALLDIPRVAVSLSLIDAVQGRFVPRALELDDLRAAMPSNDAPSAGSGRDWREAAFDVLAALRAPLPEVGETAQSSWSRLRLLRVANAHLTLRDPGTGIEADLSGLKFDIARGVKGGATVATAGRLRVGSAVLQVEATANLPANSGEIATNFHLSSFVPAQLADAAEIFAPLIAGQLPVSASGRVVLDGNFGFKSAGLDIQAQTGSVLIADGVLPLKNADLHLDILPDQALLTLRQLVLQTVPTATPTHLAGRAVLRRAVFADAPGVGVELDLTADQVGVDDLPAFWPLGVGGPGTRPWLVENTHGGMLRNARVGVSLTAPLDFSDALVSRLEGGVDGSDCGVTWLTGVPPIEHATGKLVFTGPDTLEIRITGGRQSGSAIASTRALLRFSGLAARDQFLAIDGDLAGPLADVAELLHHPSIRLLQKSHFAVRDPAGQVRGRLTVDMPLKNDLRLDDVKIGVTGQLADGHISGIAAGRDVDRAAVDFAVDNKGLKLSGSADLAGVPSTLSAKLDFRPLPASQVVEQFDASMTMSANRLAAFGVAHGGALSGATKLQLGYQARRSGDGELRVLADLAGLGIADPRIAWSKPEKAPGQLELHGLLRHGDVTAFDRISADAPGLVLRGSAELAPDLTTLHLDTLHLGEGTDLTMLLKRPANADLPTDVVLQGDRIDLSKLLVHRAEDRKARGPAYHVTANVKQATMANGIAWKDVAADIASDGLITLRASVDAKAGSGAASLRIVPSAGGRELSAKADDAGAMLGALDLSQRMAGGKLVASGHFDDTQAEHPLDGSAEIDDFRVRDAPAMVRLLQAMSLYGLIDAARGPGLGFTTMIAPFRLTDDALTLRNVRAYSSALGFTAKGSIDLATHVADLEGTAVPLYVFNSMLGRLPLVGKLFSPEEDGGLFVVSYSIRGNLDDPHVGVNPLSALTPGFLRGFFDLFGSAQPAVQTPPAAQP